MTFIATHERPRPTVQQFVEDYQALHGWSKPNIVQYMVAARLDAGNARGEGHAFERRRLAQLKARELYSLKEQYEKARCELHVLLRQDEANHYLSRQLEESTESRSWPVNPSIHDS